MNNSEQERLVPSRLQSAGSQRGMRDGSANLSPSHHPFLPHSRAARVVKTTGDESGTGANWEGGSWGGGNWGEILGDESGSERKTCDAMDWERIKI